MGEGDGTPRHSQGYEQLGGEAIDRLNTSAHELYLNREIFRVHRCNGLGEKYAGHWVAIRGSPTPIDSSVEGGVEEFRRRNFDTRDGRFIGYILPQTIL